MSQLLLSFVLCAFPLVGHCFTLQTHPATLTLFDAFLSHHENLGLQPKALHKLETQPRPLWAFY